MKVAHLISALSCLLVLAGCAASEIKTASPSNEVIAKLRTYYADKYPAYAELSRMDQLPPQVDRDKVNRLRAKVPVSQVINSFPGRPLVSFSERTKTADAMRKITTVDVFAADDGGSRVVIHTKQAKRAGSQAFADARPMTVEALRKLLK